MLQELLDAIPQCRTCSLMEENDHLGIPYVPIKPKPQAKFMFVGRDPSPRTATVVGNIEGRSDSVFISEIQRISAEANIPNPLIYITDLCKCHWRTSRGQPLTGTGHRNPIIPHVIIKKCLDQWLIREIVMLHPAFIVGFGEEVYQALSSLVQYPERPPKEFSSSRDKSVDDAEKYFSEVGSMTLVINGESYQFHALRHPGNSASLPRSDADVRRRAHIQSRERLLVQLQVLAREEPI